MRIAPVIPRTALYATLAAWAGLTITRQVNPTFKHLVTLERFGLTIPNYRFFGPLPAVHDNHLLIRYHLADGRTGPWRQLALGEERRLLHMLWAPNRRLDKALADAVSELMTLIGVTRDIRRLSNTVPYQALLNVAVFGVEHPPDARSAQFAIGNSAAFDDSVVPKVIFASDVHELVTPRVPQRDASRN